MIRRILIATIAAVAGLTVAGGLVVYDRTGQPAETVYATTTDLPAGAHLTGSAVRLVPAALGGRQIALAYRAGEKARLASTQAAHDLTAGQIIQRSDTQLVGQDAERALVLVPLKDAPPIRAGDHVDLLMVSGAGDNLAVSLFAAGVEVHSVTGGGVVLDVAAVEAPGFVYASAALRLVAVAISADRAAVGRRPDEVAISSSEQARAVVRR